MSFSVVGLVYLFFTITYLRSTREMCNFAHDKLR